MESWAETGRPGLSWNDLGLGAVLFGFEIRPEFLSLIPHKGISCVKGCLRLMALLGARGTFESGLPTQSLGPCLSVLLPLPFITAQQRGQMTMS